MAHVKNLIAVTVILTCCGGVILLVAPPAHAQPKPDHQTRPDQPYVLPRLDGPVQLDGWSDEAAWETVSPLPVQMYMPTWGAEPSERTEVRVAYDDDFVYVSGRLYYNDPDKIRASTRRRDNTSSVNDMFLIALDTFDDNESGLMFLTTPSGTRSDVALANDMEGEQSTFFKTSWNTFWETASARDERGWFVEMRIPLRSLRFQERNGRVKMGLIVWRWIAHKQEAILYPAISNQWGWWGQFKPSQARTVVLEGIESRRPLYVTPYLLGGLGQDYALSSGEKAYVRRDELTYDVGLDVKYGLTNNLTLDLTVNTDFAQVEADNEQVNLTRFSLFFPEKRRFFLERSGIFDFGVSPTNRLFYSRRIGLHEGRPIRILGGARLVGRVGGWDVGVLDMQTARTDLRRGGSLPSENFGVLRLRRRVFNPYSYVGAMTTSRIGADGTYNLAYGLDGNVRVTGDEYLRFDWAHTVENDRPAGLEAVRVHAGWARRTTNGFGYEAFFTRSGRHYTPGVGFELRDDYTKLRGRLFHGRLADPESALQRRTAAMEGEVFLRNNDGTAESIRITPSWEYYFKSEATVAMSASIRYEDLRRPFLLSGKARVPPGAYTFYQLEANYDMADSRLFDADAQLQAGTFYDGTIASVSAMPTWSLSTGLKLSGFYQFSHIRFPERAEDFDAHVGRLRLRAMPSTQLTMSAFVQYGTATDRVSINVRLRYTPHQGNDLYLVYNEGLNTNRHRHTPTLPVTNSRTIIAKYTYTFDF
jgi:hypothetical protein